MEPVGYPDQFLIPLIPIVIVVGIILLGFLVSGMRAARLRRLIERQTEAVQQQTLLLARIEKALKSGSPKAD